MDRRVVPVNDQRIIFQIILWFLFVVAILSLGARLGTKYAMTRKLAWDDWLMLAAQVGSALDSRLGSASRGLGKPLNTLTKDAVENLLEAEYASVIFQLLTLALIKWSISAFIRQLSRTSTHQRLDWIFRVTVGLWVMSAILTSLFQCAFPRPWDYIHNPRCINRRSWWAFVVVVNIATELIIVALYILIIRNLQISLIRKMFVLMIFTTRLLVVGIALAQLTAFLNAFPGPDLTDDLWLPTVLNQALLSASIVTACAPYLRPFMESLESGVTRVENLPGSEDDLSHGGAGPSAYYLTDFTSSAMCASRTPDP
ncbi:hypothetical protein GGS21DRAFT_544344 [Xylaria nigripes]|nr:hypothetical protein GGS21DRAFT_544344 [Xylaria nigripes]